MPSYCLEIYGCQMNVADGRLVAGILAQSGWTEVRALEEADAILMVTCAVREKAVARVLGRSSDLSRHKAGRPGMVIALLGCVAQYLSKDALPKGSGLDLLVGPDGYRKLPELLSEAMECSLAQSKIRVKRKKAPSLLRSVQLDTAETYEECQPLEEAGPSAFVTVQRGCNRFCAYCVVPLVRGRERAIPPDVVAAQVEGLVARGVRQVTLLGQSVSAYRHQDVTFAQLLQRVARVPGLARVRFTSPHPACFDESLIQVLADEPTVCPHLHLPVQSGSTRVLGAMGRGHTAEDYLQLVAQIRKAVPHMSFTTDFLVGFPGETEQEYRQTLELCEQVGFDTAFMFAYSVRNGTRAQREMNDDVSAEEKGRRLAELIVLQEGFSATIMGAQAGKTVEVLVEGRAKRETDKWVGRTDTFRNVVVEGNAAPGDIIKVQIERGTPHTLNGKVV